MRAACPISASAARRRVALAAGVLALAVLGSLDRIARARRVRDPVGLGGLVGAGVDAITGGLGGAAADGFGAILKALFSWPAKLINRQLLAWLVAVPDYAIAPEHDRRARPGSNLAELAPTTSAMAFAALAAVGTVAGAALLGGRAERLGRLRGARRARADGRRGVADRAVAVAVPARARTWPTRRRAACWAAAACSTTPRGCSAPRSRRA